MRSERSRVWASSWWWTAATTVAVVGWVTALVVTPPSALLASTVVCAALALIVSAGVETTRGSKDSPSAAATPTVDGRRLLDLTLVGTVGAVAVLGLLQVSVGLTALVVLCLGGSAPWALSSTRTGTAAQASAGDPPARDNRSAAGPPSPPQPPPAAAPTSTGAVPASEPITPPGDLPAVSSLSTSELVLAWRRSYSELSAARSPQQLESVAARRQQLLDELERRDGHGVQRWLHSGARAASDPSRFLQRRG